MLVLNVLLHLHRWEDDNFTDTLSPWDMEPTPDDEGTSDPYCVHTKFQGA